MTFGGGGDFAKVGHDRRQRGAAADRHVPRRRDQPDRHRRHLLHRRSEEIVGEVLEGRRDDFLLATKVRFPMGEDPNMAGLSRHHVIEGCEASLRRLRTDHIDLYQVHEWDGLTPLRGDARRRWSTSSTRARSATSGSATTPPGRS